MPADTWAWTTPADDPDAEGPDGDDHADLLTQSDAEALGLRIQDHAARIAELTCEFLLLLAEFDRRDGLRWYVGLKSLAHWLSWACSMAPGTAREHVRVARALAQMPLTVEAFRGGRLSFSKVRALTRAVGRVDEETMVELAQDLTASQLERTVSALRAAQGTHVEQSSLREARWWTDEQGMVHLSATLPAETGAEVVTALERLTEEADARPVAEDDPPPGDDKLTADAPPLAHRRADAVVELARSHLARASVDRSGEDRHLVVMQVDLAALEHPGEGTSGTGADRAWVRGAGSVEAETAARWSCTDRIALAIAGHEGEILHLGRAKRLVSRAQRRALAIRDTTCQFPGCHQTRHLDSHHVVPWSEGGPTDIENLVLLCRRHHVTVHEGGLRLSWEVTRPGTPSMRRVLVVRHPDGRRVDDDWPTPRPVRESGDAGDCDTRRPGDPDPDPEPDPERIFPRTGGGGFSLRACVDALLAAA
ncbi:DUF222 domain-containing protein [Brachybacterium sp. EF45031]|uniref:HNH endonuclease signature motif containing protein n=1 Tax=Brachybacterium sillae TaxID=2810536 RepID=UPI00217CC6BF|nr:HNH endonuclease signature motif containing protein [Brachybacterium sillae]MCS6711755.1 DUF222 domain-containing protein [Brachybacterium sillae]